MERYKKQRLKQGKAATVLAYWPNRLARETKEVLYAGLEEFVNVGDSEAQFQAFATKCPTFWPLDTQDPRARLLRWDAAARALFLAFRDYLRKVWISDPKAHEYTYLTVLLGLDVDFADRPEAEAWSFQRQGLNEAWAELRKVYPQVGIGIRPIVTPGWGLAAFCYEPTNDFQRAVYQLFLENWRARVCPRCSKYFIAEKAAQVYCSTACSGGVKRERSRAWWNLKGAARRSAARKSARRK